MPADSALTLDRLLVQLAGVPDDRIPLVRLALLIAACDLPGVAIEPYEDQLDLWGVGVRSRFEELILAGADDTAATRLAALKHILVDCEGFIGDRLTYDDPQNANLIRVLERRCGLPISLAILYLHVGQVAGLTIEGVNFPGHFLLRLTYRSDRLIFDPFNSCRLMQAPDLRSLLKTLHGSQAELSADYYQRAGHRAILIRLQNNIKKRQIEDGNYVRALQTIEMMQKIDPDEYRLWLDAGVLYARVGEKAQAIAALEHYLACLGPGHPQQREAENLIWQIKYDQD